MDNYYHDAGLARMLVKHNVTRLRRGSLCCGSQGGKLVPPRWEQACLRRRRYIRKKCHGCSQASRASSLPQTATVSREISFVFPCGRGLVLDGLNRHCSASGGSGSSGLAVEDKSSPTKGLSHTAGIPTIESPTVIRRQLPLQPLCSINLQASMKFIFFLSMACCTSCVAFCRAGLGLAH